MSAARARKPRRERRPDERPAELLEAALRVFAERGYHNASLDDVATAAGVTKGAIYHYFESKHELLVRAIEHHQTLGYEQLEQAVADSRLPIAARIRALLRAAFGAQDTETRPMLVMLQSVVRDVPEVHAQWLASGPKRAWDLLTELIEEGKATGEFRGHADANIAARVIFSGVLLQALWQRHAPTIPGFAIDRDRLIDSASDLLLAGLGSDA